MPVGPRKDATRSDARTAEPYFGFDYLCDNMGGVADGVVQARHAYSKSSTGRHSILVDDALPTPLIILGLAPRPPADLLRLSRALHHQLVAHRSRLPLATDPKGAAEPRGAAHEYDDTAQDLGRRQRSCVGGRGPPLLIANLYAPHTLKLVTISGQVPSLRRIA